MSKINKEFPRDKEVCCSKCGQRIIVRLMNSEQARRKTIFCGRPCQGYKCMNGHPSVIRFLDKKQEITQQEYYTALRKHKLGVNA